MERGLREVVTPPPMSEQRPKRDSMSLEEATVSTMLEIAAIVEGLERKGLWTKHDLYDLITEFSRKNLLFNLTMRDTDYATVTWVHTIV